MANVRRLCRQKRRKRRLSKNSPARWRNGDAATAPASHAIARSLAVSGGPVNSRAQVSSQPGQGPERSAVGQVARRVSRAHGQGDGAGRAQPVLQAEGCGGEESTGPRTPSLGVCCLERASQRLSGCRGLQAEEKLRLQMQKARTPRRSCAALLQRLSGPRFAGRREAQARGAEEAEGAHTPTLVCCFVAAFERSAVCRQKRSSG
jgi:hypothetical protein